MVVRAGTPRPIIDKLNGVLMPYLGEPEVQDKLKAVAIEPRTSTPDEMQTFLANRARQMGARSSRTPASSRSERSRAQSSFGIFACSIIWRSARCRP